MEQVKKQFIINGIYYGLWLLIILISGKFLFKYILPFVIAVIVASLMQKPAGFLSKKIGVKKGILATFLSAVVYILLAVVLIFVTLKIFSLTGKVIKSLSGFADIATKIYNTAEKISEGVFGNISPELKETGNKIFQSILESGILKVSSILSNGAANVVKFAPTFILSSIVALAATCYIAKDYDGFVKFLEKIIPQKTARNILKIKEIFKESVLKILGGYIILMFITFAELSLGLLVLRVENWLIIGAVIALLDVLPVLGSGAFLIPWGIINVIIGNKFLGIGLLSLYLIIMFVRNFAEAKIVGNKTGINPLFVLFTMFLGLKLFGFLGLVGLPVTFIVVIKYYKNEMEQELS